KGVAPLDHVNKTFCSRFRECGRAGPPTDEKKGYLPSFFLSSPPCPETLRSSFKLDSFLGLVPHTLATIDFSSMKTERRGSFHDKGAQVVASI
ncbi:hypothetical protein WH47_04897, partial [Habropoda laboriosa]